MNIFKTFCFSIAKKRSRSRPKKSAPAQILNRLRLQPKNLGSGSATLSCGIASSSYLSLQSVDSAVEHPPVIRNTLQCRFISCFSSPSVCRKLSKHFLDSAAKTCSIQFRQFLLPPLCGSGSRRSSIMQIRIRTLGTVLPFKNSLSSLFSSQARVSALVPRKILQTRQQLQNINLWALPCSLLYLCSSSRPVVIYLKIVLNDLLLTSLLFNTVIYRIYCNCLVLSRKIIDQLSCVQSNINKSGFVVVERIQMILKRIRILKFR